MILEVKDLASGYGGSEVLHGISFQVEEGRLVAILGPNGAGKTTLLKTIMGLVRTSRGIITFDGTKITGHSPNDILRRGITYVPQGRSIFPWMSVQDNLRMGGYLIRERQLVSKRLDEVYSLFPRLSERKDADAGVLSGGERQMLVIGRALMLAPKMIMLDEPSLGLDPKFLQAVYNRLVDLNKSGIAIILVEQNVKKALEIVSEAHIINTGSIIMEGSSQELKSRQDISEIYLGSVTKSQS